MYSDFDSTNLLCQKTENLSRWLVFYHSSLLLQIQDYNSLSIQVSWKFSIDIMHCVSTEVCPRPTGPKSATYVAQYELGETIKEPLPLPTYTCYHGHIKVLSGGEKRQVSTFMFHLWDSALGSYEILVLFLLIAQRISEVRKRGVNILVTQQCYHTWFHCLLTVQWDRCSTGVGPWLLVL